MLLTFLIGTLVLTLLPVPVKAASGSYTKVFVTSPNDGHVLSATGVYATSHDAASGTVADTATTFRVGQITSDYTIWRGFLFFDTSSLPDGATVTAATLGLYVSSDGSAVDFNVTVQSGQPTYPHDPLVAGDYLYSLYTSSGGTKNTSLISGVGYWNITLNSTGVGFVSKTSTTKLCLRSYEDQVSSTPTGNEYVEFSSYEASREYAALLYVSYSVSSTYLYELYGPYSDAPIEVANCTVDILVQYDAGVSELQLLDGSFGTVDVAVIASSVQPVLITWNISSTGNYSRTMYFVDDAGPFFIFVPSLDTPCGLYTFNIIDMQGITNGYLASRIYYNGSYQTVERHSITSLSAVPLYMQWAVTYDLYLTCDEGASNLGAFTALSVDTANLVISFNSFPMSYSSTNCTVSAARLNASLIQVNFTDPAESLLSWVYVKITHVQGGTAVTDYTDNVTDTTVQWNWNSAGNSTDYWANVTFYRDGNLYSYNFSCPAPVSIDNPWSFIDAPYCYVIAVFISVAAGLVFSYATVAGGAWAMTGFAGFFCWVGWLPVEAWGAVAGGGLVSGLITISEWKKTEREL